MEQAPIEVFVKDGHIRPLADVERDCILHAFKALDGNITRSAAALGISRRTMQSKLGEYRKAGMTFEIKHEVSVVVSDRQNGQNGGDA